jgi:peptidoglycan/xylan/chitin deacetylase (PgdA/CDA1 family)
MKRKSLLIIGGVAVMAAVGAWEFMSGSGTVQYRTMPVTKGDIDATVAGRLSDLGDTAVLWSLDSLDWSLNDADAITANVLDNVRPGEIILMHSTTNREATAQALPRIITGLEKQGYSFIGLDEMLGTPAYR